MTVPHTSQSITNHPIWWLLGLQIVHQNRTESKSRFFVENRIEIDRLAKISYRHSTIVDHSSLNAGGIARDHMSFRFWISCLFPDIFAIKVGSCLKSVEILYVFGLPNFLGEDPPNFWTCVKKLTHMLITVQSFAAIGRRSSEILCLVKKIK